ncbi:MAG: nicotinate (nicotinamide) nucleotide adenylyltransferase [Candidatus Omnitrophota bacterium]|nr:MAG: nicotinate (nicotinamide) nucleotide adenylyltransferase [Candidatus Omnitrophota bacterium]
MEMDRQENKIGIFGGCFDPVHIGHLVIAEFAYLQFNLEKIIFIPAKIPPHKEKVFATPTQRLEMLRLAISDNENFEVSDMEIKREGPSYTYDTIISFKMNNPGKKIYLIIGEDEFVNLHSWYKINELVKEVIFLVAPRFGKEIKMPHPDLNLKYEKIDSPRIEVSSSFLRNQISSGIYPKYLIPERVLEYIKKERLYGN